MNVNDDLFGNVNLNEEIEVIEEVSSEGKAGTDGEGAAKPQASVNTNSGNKPDIDIKGLDEELIDVIDNPDAEDETGGASDDNNGKGTPSSKKDDSNSSSSPDYKPIADLSKVFFDEGVLTQFDEEEFKTLVEETGDPIKALAILVQKTIEGVHEDWINNYPAPIQDLIRAAQQGLPLDQMFSIKQNQFQLEGITEERLTGEEGLNLRKEILAEHLRNTTNFSEEKIKKSVDRTVSLGEDEEEAKEALKDLKSIAKEREKQLKEETKKQQDLQQKQYTERLESLKKDVYATTEIIPGVKLSKQEQDTLYTSMTKYVTVDKDGTPMTDADLAWAKNPIEMRKAFHYYFKKGLFNVDDKTGRLNPDFSKVTNTLKTQITKEQKDAANGSRPFKSGTPEARLQEMETSARGNLGSSLEAFVKNRK